MYKKLLLSIIPSYSIDRRVVAFGTRKNLWIALVGYMLWHDLIAALVAVAHHTVGAAASPLSHRRIKCRNNISHRRENSNSTKLLSLVLDRKAFILTRWFPVAFAYGLLPGSLSVVGHTIDFLVA